MKRLEFLLLLEFSIVRENSIFIPASKSVASNWKEGWLSKRTKSHSEKIRVDGLRHKMTNDY